MWEKLRVVFTIPELRQKILLTLGLLAVYRIGFWIPLPVVDTAAMKNYFDATANEGLQKMISQVAMFSGSQINQATIFGLGIMPYISASIIFQLLGSVWKPLEELQKEGETGRKKINEYTRYATVVLCLIQSWFYVSFLVKENLINATLLNDNGGLSFSWYLISVLTMTGGTIFLMWLGEQIDEFGIGNGISLLIMANILARMPQAFVELLQPVFKDGTIALSGSAGEIGLDKLILLIALFVGVVFGVVFIYKGQRRIPMQSAKHVRGRRVYGGNRQYLPLRVNQAGVMPIIFASSLLLFPAIFLRWLGSAVNSTWMSSMATALESSNAFTHNFLFVALIYFFCYFWTAVTFNPKDMADNLKGWGSFIPGYRPGRRTADYLEKVMARITYVGAAFLAVVAIAPTIVASSASIPQVIAGFYGGTSLLIAVSVAVDLVQKIDSHLVMRNYKGLTE
ncbi:MAG: preprotein translocase subunit SecY [Planctomycetia bacterium]|nr:preprotein translocase subunit SecY [Planctomycetia bacterium]